MILTRTRPELQRGLASIGDGGRLALVPTMGSLHEGHLSLIDRARKISETVAVSIFVNPTQFGPGEDFEEYPRTLDDDLERARDRGVGLVFAPDDESVVYPDGEPRVTVDPGSMADRLCGAHRPGHFRGVLTVVAKLFGLLRPDVAVFGRKDFQQVVLIRRMVDDLELGVEIESAPIVREEDGLALSSRNAYLSPEERTQAAGLYEGLVEARRRYRDGVRRAEELREAVDSEVGARSRLTLEYAEIVDPMSLDAVDPVEAGSVLALAAYCGQTRLIDNIVLE